MPRAQIGEELFSFSEGMLTKLRLSIQAVAGGCGWGNHVAVPYFLCVVLNDRDFPRDYCRSARVVMHRLQQSEEGEYFTIMTWVFFQYDLKEHRAFDFDIWLLRKIVFQLDPRLISPVYNFFIRTFIPFKHYREKLLVGDEPKVRRTIRFSHNNWSARITHQSVVFQSESSTHTKGAQLRSMFNRSIHGIFTSYITHVRSYLCFSSVLTRWRCLRNTKWRKKW